MTSTHQSPDEPTNPDGVLEWLQSREAEITDRVKAALVEKMIPTSRAAPRWICDLCGTESGHSGAVMLTDTGRLICYGGCPPPKTSDG